MQHISNDVTLLNETINNNIAINANKNNNCNNKEKNNEKNKEISDNEINEFKYLLTDNSKN